MWWKASHARWPQLGRARTAWPANQRACSQVESTPPLPLHCLWKNASSSLTPDHSASYYVAPQTPAFILLLQLSWVYTADGDEGSRGHCPSGCKLGWTTTAWGGCCWGCCSGGGCRGRRLRHRPRARHRRDPVVSWRIQLVRGRPLSVLQPWRARFVQLMRTGYDLKKMSTNTLASKIIKHLPLSIAIKYKHFVLFCYLLLFCFCLFVWVFGDRLIADITSDAIIIRNQRGNKLYSCVGSMILICSSLGK